MGLLAADLARYRSARAGTVKTAAAPVSDPVGFLRIGLEAFTGAQVVLEKSASPEDYHRLYTMHREIERAYRESVKIGKKPEADEILSKFSGWSWLRGAPGEPGDWTPLPAPDEK